ncbi:MAG: Fe-S cluster assembly protein SufD [Betaproteobacteria bacterium]
MTHESALPFVADFERAERTLPGAGTPWLERLRRDALARFAEAGVPTRRDEEWKYTSLATLEKQRFTALPNGSERTFTKPEVQALALDVEGHRLVFVDGHYAPGLSHIASLPSGATLATMAQVLADDAACVEPFLVPAPNATIFAQLNTAFMTDGLYLRLARGTVVEEPIHLVFIATGMGRAVHPRNVVVAAPGSAATIIEHYAGGDASYFTNALTQIVAADGAAIEHLKLQQEGAHGIHIGAIHAAQARASRFASLSIALGGALARTDITTSFDAEGCEATLDGLYVLDGSQHVDHHTRIDHAKPHGTSREHYRGVLDGNARAVFNGKVVVHAGASKTDARQTNHNLLLSRGAEVDTKPQLEIYADDVKCTHGATVGQLDPAQLFYLRSRGLDEPAARALLTHAFAREVIDRIRLAPVRERLAELLSVRLPQGPLLIPETP